MWPPECACEHSSFAGRNQAIMAGMRPDFLIQKRVAMDNKYAESSVYCQKMVRISQSTAWFESKTKYDFVDTEKRNDAFIKKELEAANAEIKKRRRQRLQLLYEHEARAYEDELNQLGLAIQRQHF